MDRDNSHYKGLNNSTESIVQSTIYNHTPVNPLQKQCLQTLPLGQSHSGRTNAARFTLFLGALVVCNFHCDSLNSSEARTGILTSDLSK